MKISEIRPQDLYKYSENELIYIYLKAFNFPRFYSIDNIEHQKSLYDDFKTFISKTKHAFKFDQFLTECKWWWNLIPIEDLTNSLPVFSYYSKPITNTKPRANINLLRLYQVIKDPKYFERQTNELRSLTDKKEKAEYKKSQFDYVTFSGVFSQRKSESIITPTGYLCIDLDHLVVDLIELKNNLIKDNVLDVQLMFNSPSGDGLKVVIPYEVQEFPVNEFIEFFRIAKKYFMDIYNLPIDEQCQDTCRACFICHDSEVYINPKILNYVT